MSENQRELPGIKQLLSPGGKAEKAEDQTGINHSSSRTQKKVKLPNNVNLLCQVRGLASGQGEGVLSAYG